MFFIVPRISVNCNLMNFTSFSLTNLMISALVYLLILFSFLSTRTIRLSSCAATDGYHGLKDDLKEKILLIQGLLIAFMGITGKSYAIILSAALPYACYIRFVRALTGACIFCRFPKIANRFMVLRSDKRAFYKPAAFPVKRREPDLAHIGYFNISPSKTKASAAIICENRSFPRKVAI